jgi:hypothetical protein
MPEKVIIVDREFGIADHIEELWKRVALLEAAVFPAKDPFVYTEGWDKGFAGEGDPYGISEYTGESANPDAFKPAE